MHFTSTTPTKKFSTEQHASRCWISTPAVAESSRAPNAASGLKAAAGLAKLGCAGAAMTEGSSSRRGA
eukprot:scaffold236944_cov14-Tisochrysis_lutea.AAC.1